MSGRRLLLTIFRNVMRQLFGEARKELQRRWAKPCTTLAWHMNQLRWAEDEGARFWVFWHGRAVKRWTRIARRRTARDVQGAEVCAEEIAVRVAELLEPAVGPVARLEDDA